MATKNPYAEGYYAGSEYESSRCPYKDANDIKDWYEGYDAAQDDDREEYNDWYRSLFKSSY